MQVKIYWVGSIGPGRIAIMSRPRGSDWLKDEIRSLGEAGVDVVVSLLEKEEVAELSLDLEARYCAAQGIKFISLPIADRSIPPSIKSVRELISSLANLLSEGKSIVIHCRQGVGRSALIAAIVMASNGLTVSLPQGGVPSLIPYSSANGPKAL